MLKSIASAGPRVGEPLGGKPRCYRGRALHPHVSCGLYLVRGAGNPDRKTRWAFVSGFGAVSRSSRSLLAQRVPETHALFHGYFPRSEKPREVSRLTSADDDNTHGIASTRRPGA